MRYLVLSDIHGNLEALDGVLAAAAEHAYDRVLVLGDLVGYGADPNGVVERVHSLAPQAIIRGNHDKVAAGVEEAEGFNSVARSAVHWTLDALTDEHREYLASLPTGPVFVDDLIEICHGTPYDEDAYVFDEIDALKALESAERPLCLFGHTHVPVIFTRIEDRLEFEAGWDDPLATLTLAPGQRYLVNPGSVGQPRDGDPRAAYCIVDTDRKIVELYRVTYAVDEAQKKIVEAGLPDVLAKRLGLGR